MATNLCDWLQGLGLGCYAEVFAANGIDFDVIADLGEADLAALGVSLGDRKRLARALDRKHVAARAGASANDPGMQPRPVHGPAERRWMTVLFCDLVGSTELSDRLDPEELRDVISIYQDAVVGAVVRFRGYVGNFRGDGIIAYFGWPHAYEDQAERAVRAALAALKGIANLSTRGRPPLRARVGISTGQVVINDIVAEGVPLAEAIGRTPNLAARLQATAASGEILIDEPTREEIGRHFTVEPLPPLAVKGLAAPVAAWRVIRQASVPMRFEARILPRGVLIGRTTELATLIERWQQARGGAGQVVLLSGEAGVGKSRLLEALGEAVSEQPLLRLRYQCSPLHSDTPLYPVRRQLERSLQIEEHDSDAVRLEKIAANLDPLYRDPRTTTLIADLLSLDTKGSAPLPDEPPPLRRERLWSSLMQLPLRLSAHRPALALLEDAQWIDPSTQELALRFFQEVANHKVLLVITQRTPFGPQWMAGNHVSTLTLNRLDEAESAALIRVHAGSDLDPALVRSIGEKADGVPLFIEEITRAVLERRTANLSERAADADTGVPPTLQASLTSRLDRLESAKILAQIGAVIGRQFPVRLLAAVAERGIDELSADVERLLQAGLLFMRQTTSETTLYFKHALVQEAAYEGLQLAERRRLHAAVLRSLEELYPAQIDALVETLATHAERAEDWPRAAKYLCRACTKAIGRFANREAISLYHRAIKALAHLPLQSAAPMAIDLRLHAFSAFQAIGDNDKMVELIGEAERFSEQIGDRRRLAAAASQSAFALWMIGDHAKALVRGEASLAIARSLEDFSLTLAAQFYLANVHHARGDLTAAVDLHREVVRMLPGELAAKRFGWGGAPGLFSRAFLAWCLTELGEFEQARQVLDQGMQILSKLEQPFSRVMIQLATGLYHMRRGEFDPATSILRDALDLSGTADVLTMYPMAAAWLGQALLGADRTAEALTVLKDAVDRETYRFGGKYSWIHLYLAYAEARFRHGDREGSRAELRHALYLAESCREIVHYAYGRKLQGDFLLSDGEPANARAAYERAIEIAEPRRVRPLAAHCKWGIGRCARLSDDPAEALRWASLAREEFGALGLSHWEARVAAEFRGCVADPHVSLVADTGRAARSSGQS
jgi:class 3 adenylate cyclase/tetratricopeptide (TPR) repeat protein